MGLIEGLLRDATNIVLVLLILVVLVVIHELGHFLAARRARVRVHEFGIGFPPKARTLGRDHETEYTLNWLPIGGFVRLEGEEGESADPRAFVNQRLATRLVILLAGVAMNFLLAWFIFGVIAGVADPVAMPRVASVQEGSPAEEIGLVGGQPIDEDDDGNVIYDETGDLIVAIDGRRFPVFDSIERWRTAPQDYLRSRAGQDVTLTVRHLDGSQEDVTVRLRPPAEAAESGALGIGIQRIAQEDVQHGPVDAVVLGFRRTVDASTLILRGVRDLVTNLADPQVAGPIGIVQTVGAVRAELPPVFLFWFIGVLSANLAIINALPFPPMDGGRVAMSLAQSLSGQRITPAMERAVYLTGFVLIMALVLWITFFDVGLLQRS